MCIFCTYCTTCHQFDVLYVFYSVDDYSHCTLLSRSIQITYICNLQVAVTCSIDESGKDCDSHLKIKKSTCGSNRNNISIPVTIRWQYCNNDTEVQLPNAKKTVAKYEKWTHQNDKSENMLQPGRCVELTSKKLINLCGQGAVMSMSYEAVIPSRISSKCSAYKVLKPRKVFLPEDSCSATVSSTYYRIVIRNVYICLSYYSCFFSRII